MKVVGIVGSPREGSNTEILVRKVLEGASSRSAEIELFKINEMNIRGCQGCFHCQEHGECKEKDDMQKIYSSLKEAEALVLGTPIYWSHVTAQTKSFIDRLFAMTNVFRGESELKGKKLILIYSQGAGSDGERIMREIGRILSDFCGMKVIGIIGGNGLNEPRAVEKREDLLKLAYKLGAQLL